MKSIMQWTSLLVLTAGLTAGCTSRSRNIEVAPDTTQRPPSADAQTPSVSPTGPAVESVQGSQVDAPGMASTGVVFNEHSLKSNYAIDTSNLKYKFKYLSKEESGDIKFNDQGKATLSFSGLKVGQSGTLSLELLEGTVVKLRGVKENVTLQAGSNNKIDLQMKAVTDTTDLILDVTLEDGSNNTNPNTPPNNNDTLPPDTNNNNNNPPPTPDPISDWDGKSNRGNSEWNIVPVDATPT